MKPIQPILILLLAAIAAVYILRLRKKSYDRLVIILLMLAGVVLVSMPDLSANIAHKVGVGRGVDLVIYLGLMGLSYVCLLLYSKIRGLEAALTELVRASAIADAHKPQEIGATPVKNEVSSEEIFPPG